MPPYFGAIAAVALVFGILGAVVFALVRITSRVVDLKSRVFCAYLTRELVAIRRGDYVDRGLYLEPGRLKRKVKREVCAFELSLRPLRTPWISSWDCFCIANPTERGATVRKIWSDLLPQSSDDFGKKDQRLRSRKLQNAARLKKVFAEVFSGFDLLHTRVVSLVTFVWSFLLVAALRLNLWDLLRAASANDFEDLLGSLSSPFRAPIFALEPVLGMLGSAAFAGFAAIAISSIVARYDPATPVGTEAVDLEDPAPHAGAVSKPKPPPIAPGRRIVRALNFAGGGFDAIMQFGVAHALLVTQGKAPDAIVGVSAGAITATAVAEILQEGRDASPRAERLLAKIHRLRIFIEAAQRAPGDLVDAVLPDAYQIDSLDPLLPLDQPRFARDERRQRLQSTVTRSGLARLYNDLLALDISIGTIARLTRRILGLKALGELPRTQKWLGCFGEIISLLSLFRQNLRQTSSLLPTLLTPLVANLAEPHAMTAGGLLFFNSWTRSRLWRELLKVLSFLLMMLVWLSVLLLPALIVVLLWTHGWGPAALILPLAIIVVYACYVGRTEHLSLPSTLQVIATINLAYALGTASALTVFLFLRIAARAWIEVFLWLSVQPHEWSVLGHAILQQTPFDRSIYRFIYTTALGVTLTGFAIGLVLGLVLWLRQRNDSYANRILEVYGLRRSLFQNYGLQQFLVRHFDRTYYGTPHRDSVLENAIVAGDIAATRVHVGEKKVGFYCEPHRDPPIHLGIAVADACTGELSTAANDMGLVKAITASCAATPLFPPIEHEGRVLLDGRNVANQPTRAMIDLLRPLLLDQPDKVVHVYAVSPFPLSKPLGKRQEEYVNLVDIAPRAMILRRKRDALFEHNLTKRVSEALPPNFADRKGFFPASVIPIELDNTRSLNLGVLGARTEKRRALILEAVADGCRASLQVMIDRQATGNHPTLPCSAAVNGYFTQAGKPNIFPSGHKHEIGPGLGEVCAHCCIRQPGQVELWQTLNLADRNTSCKSWPHQDQAEPPTESLSTEGFKSEPTSETQVLTLPDSWKDGPDFYRPLVSCVFGGGVFRGVYQVGVLNALNELKLRPDIMAGASVGSITAAMTARAFLLQGEERHAQIARLAAVYIGMDRLILTDRFADFVRQFTLRAADTGFSIREADRFFRKYDSANFNEFSKGGRRVLAGVERLLGVNPYAVNRIAKAVRDGNWTRLWRELADHAQDWLGKMQVGDELLGAEPLRELVREYVETTPADTFQNLMSGEPPILMMATTTNLTEGKMRVITSTESNPTRLAEGLLASSAFPGVFRPRWSWEMTDGDPERSQYIDGGVIDNLPIEHVTTLLDRLPLDSSTNQHWTPRWKEHLIVVGSLESNIHPQLTYLERQDLMNNWLTLKTRAKKLGYNQKLDKYAWAERLRGDFLRAQPGKTDPAIRIVAVKPEWLCGTFAAHPMLGFRREKQKRSIAHGCASTLLRFADAELKSKLSCWRGDSSAVPNVSNWGDAFDRLQKKGAPTDGTCWLREERPCPFSRPQLIQLNAKLPKESQLSEKLVGELSEVHRLCSHPKTQLHPG